MCPIQGRPCHQRANLVYRPVIKLANPRIIKSLRFLVYVHPRPRHKRNIPTHLGNFLHHGPHICHGCEVAYPLSHGFRVHPLPLLQQNFIQGRKHLFHVFEGISLFVGIHFSKVPKLDQKVAIFDYKPPPPHNVVNKTFSFLKFVVQKVSRMQIIVVALVIFFS